MSSMFGNILKVSIFGESHGGGVGVTLHGLQSGISLDVDRINAYLKRRATGQNSMVSARKEMDKVQFLSGVYNDKTTGAPLTMFIANTDTKSGDYKEIENLARPSHADYTGKLRYNGFNDPRGGGHFSARLTTPMVMAGSIAIDILRAQGIEICGNIIQIGKVVGKRFSDKSINSQTFDKLKAMDLPCLDNKELFADEIEQARLNCDSVGGYIECVVNNFPSGVGSPIFDGVENKLASALFGIPAVKGIEFGEEKSDLYGSVWNDKIQIHEGSFNTLTNHDGGINGGITNGMPIIFKLLLKPTPSIAQSQETIEMNKMENAVLCIKGRHDPCVLTRAVPIIECVTALVMLDMLMENQSYR